MERFWGGGGGHWTKETTVCAAQNEWSKFRPLRSAVNSWLFVFCNHVGIHPLLFLQKLSNSTVFNEFKNLRG